MLLFLRIYKGIWQHFNIAGSAYAFGFSRRYGVSSMCCNAICVAITGRVISNDIINAALFSKLFHFSKIAFPRA